MSPRAGARRSSEAVRPRTPPDRHPAPACSRARLAHIDSLKVALTCAVIAAHSTITYGGDGSWFYLEPGEASSLRVALDIPLALGSLFGMGVFFFLAGCFVPASLARKGPVRFLADRWLRLGAPLLGFVLLVVPAVEWAVARATRTGRSAGTIWTDQLRSLDAGPLWFAGVLLLFSTACAAVPPATLRRAGSVPLTQSVLAAAAATVALLSFLLRLRFRIDSFQIGSAHVWQWGQCLVLFALGIAAGTRFLTGGVPPRVRRACLAAVAVGALALMALLLAFRKDLDPLGGGATAAAAGVAVTEGIMSVAAAVLLVEYVRRHRSGPPRRAWIARSAYGAYVLQAPVLVAVALALRPASVAAWAKLLVLVPAGVAGSFLLAAALLRIPALRRVL